MRRSKSALFLTAALGDRGGELGLCGTAFENSGPEDNGPEDNGSEDNGPEDNGPEDNGPEDSGPEDSGPEDSGPEDSGATGAAIENGVRGIEGMVPGGKARDSGPDFSA